MFLTRNFTQPILLLILLYNYANDGVMGYRTSLHRVSHKSEISKLACKGARVCRRILYGRGGRASVQRKVMFDAKKLLLKILVLEMMSSVLVHILLKLHVLLYMVCVRVGNAYVSKTTHTGFESYCRIFLCSKKNFVSLTSLKRFHTILRR